MDVKPVNEQKPTLRGLARGLNILHRCTDVGLEAAAAERKAIADDVLLIKGSLADQARAIGKPEDVADAEGSLFARFKVISGQLEAATAKIRRSEIVWDRIKTSAATALPLLTAFGAIFWWLAGARIGKALGLP